MPRDVSLVQNSRGEFMLCILVDPAESADEDTTLVIDPEVHVEPDRLLVVRGGGLVPLAAPRPDARTLAEMVGRFMYWLLMWRTMDGNSQRTMLLRSWFPEIVHASVYVF